ncbi:hypothetical protein PLICRDRAFT_177304 [Plicaturopsis crispa FD-325 SS-3]|nr:hypothetical protein PLICRDRAFT_177304 [Plicaturopsis crispa FD-325 SS-3]
MTSLQPAHPSTTITSARTHAQRLRAPRSPQALLEPSAIATPLAVPSPRHRHVTTHGDDHGLRAHLRARPRALPRPLTYPPFSSPPAPCFQRCRGRHRAARAMRWRSPPPPHHRWLQQPAPALDTPRRTRKRRAADDARRTHQGERGDAGRPATRADVDSRERRAQRSSFDVVHDVTVACPVEGRDGVGRGREGEENGARERERARAAGTTENDGLRARRSTSSLLAQSAERQGRAGVEGAGS